MAKKSKRYDANMPSDSYDYADFTALQMAQVGHILCRMQGMRFDSTEAASVFFARELDYVKSKTYDKLYPQLTALDNFPVTSEIAEGAETATYYSYEKTGMAKIIANYADDLPRADVKGTPTTAYVREFGVAYGYSIQEMAASRMVGKSLDVRKGEAAKWTIDEGTNRIAWAGDPDNQLIGVLSAGNNIPLYVLPETANPPAGVTLNLTSWKYKDADEIVADIAGMLQTVSTTTMGVERPDTLLIPESVYVELSLKRLPATDSSVLEYVKKNAPHITDIKCAPELNPNSYTTNPFTSPENPVGVALLYTNDPEKLAIEIPLPFVQLPMQPKNLEYTIPCRQRIAGVFIYYPLSAIIAVGVSEGGASMKLRNKSDSKIITLGGVSILPGEVGEVPAGFERNPLLKILPVEVVKEKAAKTASGEGTGGEGGEAVDEIAVVIAKLKNSPESAVRKQCEKYGVEVPEGTKLPEMKKLLIAKLTEAGDGDGGEGTGGEGEEA
jgi:hypothetical protein